MPRFEALLTRTITVTRTVTVTAKNETDAEEKVADMISDGVVIGIGSLQETIRFHDDWELDDDDVSIDSVDQI